MKRFKVTLIDRNTMQMKSATKHLLKLYSFWFLLGIIVGSGILMSFKDEPRVVTEYKIIFLKRPYHNNDISLTKKDILNELVKQKCVLPNIAFAQFSTESQHFKSDICRENKNFAGIRTSKSQYVIGMNRGHCVYKSYKDCIKDYIRIQNMYLKNINKKYAEDTTYIKVLKQIKVHLK